MRIYKPGLGKFLSVDPIASDFPYYSPYHFAGNSPVYFVDLDGQEPLGYIEYWDKSGREGTDRWGRDIYDVYDYATKQRWSIMRDPNGGYNYWKRYDGQHDNWDNNNYANNKTSKGEWEGKWVEFRPKSNRELGYQVVDGMAKAMAIVY